MKSDIKINYHLPKNKKVIAFSVAIFIALVFFFSIILKASEIDAIESFIQKQKTLGQIPGLSVVIVKGDEIVYSKGFGYANLKKMEPVTPKTLFELGSTSKAFTALGILLLEQNGLVSLGDPVKKYIPWFNMKYKQKDVLIKVENLIYQTSGIPFDTIGDIPVSNDPNALEATVRILVNKELDFLPGDKFQYATINYDVLGLLIQYLSGQSFEDYIQNNVLNPLMLNATFLSRDDIKINSVATGYKIAFGKAVEYDAPRYRGNVPAGYFITNSEDIGKWILIQLEVADLEDHFEELIDRSHVPDPSLANSFYAKGWFINANDGLIFHDGSNPNYSSSIILHHDAKIGIGVLANINSLYTMSIARGIIQIALGKEPALDIVDQNLFMDNIAVKIVYIVLIVLIILCGVLILFFVRYKKNGRKFSRRSIKGRIIFWLLLIIFICISYMLYKLPQLLVADLPWNFVTVWTPISFPIAVFSIFLFTLCSYISLSTLYFFPKSKDKKIKEI